MKNFNKPKNQSLGQLHFNIFRKASPEAMDMLLNAEAEKVIVQKSLPIRELAHRRPSHWAISSSQGLQ